MKAQMTLVATLLVAMPVFGQNPAQGRSGGAPAAQEQAAPAPPPGSAGIFKSNTDLQTVLKAAIAKTNDMATSPIALTDQYRVNIVHRPKANGAIAHPGNTELHYIIAGTGTVTTGGKIVRKPGAPASEATIEGGESHDLKPGDVIIVPAGSAHMYSKVNGEITYLEVRFVAPK
ncbi:MAG: AraC family ligand binding domain-containing protein [Acidobacteria bacterium]|nr:AraC family ligand binding domain-containing protein [Acidobacteriota bacterium]